VLAPDAALLVSEHGSGFAFDMRNSFYAMSEVGAFMLERTLRHGKANAVAAVAKAYDANPETIESDLQHFLDNLEQRGVILRRGAEAKPARASFCANLMARAAKRALAHLPGLNARAAAALTLARLSFALFGWDKTLGAWKAYIPAALPSGEQPSTAQRAINDTVRTMSAKLPLGCNCKERALSSWALARRAGVSAALVVGVVQYPLGGHTWCETRDGTILGDEAEHCATFMPVFRYE
jgi:hypothetical protein